MKRKLILLVSALLVCSAVTGAPGQGRRMASPSLTEAAKAALISALAGLDGEYAARAEYEAILDQFGLDALPYSHIIQAEERHVAALEQQCRNFNIPIPEDPYLGKIKAPASLLEAAKAGILAEEANVKMYDELLTAVQDYPSLVRAFTNLRSASANRHLPALKAAEANGGTANPEVCVQARGRRQQLGGNCQQPGTGCLRQGGNCLQGGPGWRQQERARIGR